MTLIKKLVCDVCGEEKDLLSFQFGGIDAWQMFLKKEYPYAQRQEKHVCSTKCAIKYFNTKELK